MHHGNAPPPSAGLLQTARGRVLVACLLHASMAGLLVLSSLHKALVYDEPANLEHGARVLRRGPVPPASGQRMPILALHALGCRPCAVDAVNAEEATRLKVRLPTMLFALALGVVVQRWTSEWYGAGAGLFALALYAFHPNFVAHGKQVTSDVPLAFFVVVALWAAWRLSRGRGSPAANLSLCALATSGALVSKYSGLLLPPVVAVLIALAPAGAGTSLRGRVLRAAARLLGYGLVVLISLNAVYGFRGSFERADSHPWRSQRLRPLASLPLPMPLPRAYVTGIDSSFQIQEQPDLYRGRNYALGRLNTEGVWYAIPLMLLLKTPLGLIGLALLGARFGPAGDASPAALFLGLPFAAFAAFFGLVATPQLGIRYLLPVLPLLIVFAARALAGPRPARTSWAWALALWAALSSLSFHPHYMSYFNELIGPRINAYRFLADSNLDWEDRDHDIAAFRARHPGEPLAVSPERPTAGFILVGANELVGVVEPERYRWLRENFEPVGHVGYSYLLFHVPPERLPEAAQPR